MVLGRWGVLERANDTAQIGPLIDVEVPGLERTGDDGRACDMRRRSTLKERVGWQAIRKTDAAKEVEVTRYLDAPLHGSSRPDQQRSIDMNIAPDMTLDERSTVKCQLPLDGAVRADAVDDIHQQRVNGERVDVHVGSTQGQDEQGGDAQEQACDGDG